MRRSRMLLVVLAALLAACVAVTSWRVLDASRSAMVHEVQASESLLAAERAAVVAATVTTTQEVLRQGASSSGMALGLRAGLAQVLADGLAAQPGVVSVALVDAGGVVLGAVGEPPSAMADLGPVIRPARARTDATIDVSALVPAADGARLRARFSLAEVAPQVVRPFPGEFTGTMTLVDRRGGVVFSTSKVARPWVQAPAVLRLLAAGRPGAATYRSRALDSTRLGVVEPVPGTDLMVLVGTDAATAGANAQALTLRLAGKLAFGLGISAVLVAAAVVVTRRERRRLVADRAEASALAATDQLTGLGNRRAFDDAGLELGDTAGAAVVLADVDHLKPINDQHGHAAGDAALRTIADAIRSAVRPGDRACRIGGDEFAVVLTGGGREAAEGVAARIRAAVERCGDDLSVSTGVGVVEGDGLTDALGRADAALYVAKRARVTTGPAPSA